MRDLPVRARARRRHAAAARTARTPARCRRSARASRTARSRWSEAADARLPRLRLARRRLPVPRAPPPPSQVVGEALGLSLPHSRAGARPASRSGSTWPAARRRALVSTAGATGSTTRDILTDAAVRNAMVVHAAFGGSTNLLLHIPADRPRRRPAPPDGRGLERGQPPACRGSSTCCPTARSAIPTVRVFLAGGVPEVMLHLRALGLLDARLPDRRRASRSGESSTGGSAPSGGTRLRERLLRRRTASIPTTSSWRRPGARSAA